ncbi:mariner Mos1 transposase [Trichonephila clavipes]|nr:mariner Mos1 transposase [Trichonephila clavipes]
MELPLASPASCELRSVIRFLAAKKKSAKEIHEELCQVYGEECMSSGMVRRWVRDFKNGRTDVHDEARAGRPSASDETIAKVEAAMLEDRRTTVRELLFKGLRKMGTKMLTADHKRQRVEAAQEFLAFHGTTEEEFLDSIVTGDETWVHYTTPETKEQSKQWKHPSSPRAKKFKQILSAGKIMASIFWDRKGVLLCEFMPRGTTINADRYCETLNKLRRAIQNKRRGMLTKGVRFHHDNARPHTANRTTALVERFGWEMVSHPPYSPDLAPSDFHLFPS